MKSREIILVVEDEDINRHILNKILSTKYDVIEAKNGKDALRIVNHNDQISAVLLDLIMPEMNGYEFLEELKKEQRTKLPIVVVTGGDGKNDEVEALQSGAWDFVKKPYNKEIILARLENVIQRSHLYAFQQMERALAHDPLTGLHNRSRTFAKVRELVNDNRDLKFIFLRVDVDRFALYNSAFGEEAGDELICFIADTIRNESKRHELYTYGRISADIFVICAPYTGNKELLEEFVEQAQNKVREYNRNYLLEISVGAYIIDDPKQSVEEFYHRASIASQRCKSQFGRYISYYENSYNHSKEMIWITNEMKKAIDEEQFLVYFQPKVNLATEKCCGAEALVRWRHPTKGLISPGMFIPVFEGNGFISQLDYYVWEHTCKILKKWEKEHNHVYPVSVNISRVSLYNPQLVEIFKSLIKKYKLSPELLQLEITESAYMSNQELMAETIHGLRKAGFTILMDDFGSGYSSLNTLKDIEVDVLKIDMKFLSYKDNTNKGEIILSSVIKMARWLGMSTIVEGVETRTQRDFLEGASCEYVQGFYYSKPLPEYEFERLYYQDTMIDVSDVDEQVIPLHNKTIVLIDDDEGIQSVIKEYFKDLYYVHPCTSAEEALLYLKHHSHFVRLIIVDYVLPQMNGIDFLTYCQDEEDLSFIPKIMLTSSQDDEIKIKGFSLGIYDYITKPFIKEVVIARVNHIMNIFKQYRNYMSWESSIQSIAKRDSLTELLEKESFYSVSSEIIENNPQDLKALLVLDIDNFKKIDEQYGHLKGDKVIQLVAEQMKKGLRKYDILGRFGDDEFAVLMTNLPNEKIAKKKAKAIIENISSECAHKLQLNVTLSVGITYTNSREDIDNIFEKANDALNSAKQSGKNCTYIYGSHIPDIQEDERPIVLVCGDDNKIYPAITIGMETLYSFKSIKNAKELKSFMPKYKDQVKLCCIEVAKRESQDNIEFFDYMLSCGVGDTIPMMAICQEGNIEDYKSALITPIVDIITWPFDEDIVKRKIRKAIETKE